MSGVFRGLRFEGKGGNGNLKNSTKRASIEWHTRHFLRSTDPMVVMQMPGCYDRFVNSTHRALLGSNFNIAHTLEEYERLLAESKIKKTVEDDLCYCTKLDSVLALEPQHCAFEAVGDTLRSPNRGEGD